MTTGPLPTGHARRRNASTFTSDVFDADGYDGPIPEPLVPLAELERSYYDWAWRTPSACGWHASDAEIVAEWARLKVLALSYMQGEVTRTLKGGEVVPAELPSALLTQITQREDRLYLSPGARKKARTRIDDIDDDASAAGDGVGGVVVTPERWRVMDGDASAPDREFMCDHPGCRRSFDTQRAMKIHRGKSHRADVDVDVAQRNVRNRSAS